MANAKVPGMKRQINSALKSLLKPPVKTGGAKNLASSVTKKAVKAAKPRSFGNKYVQVPNKLAGGGRPTPRKRTGNKRNVY